MKEPTESVTHMDSKTIAPREIVINLMKEAVPERAKEIDDLWKKYSPEVVLVENVCRVTLNATRDRIAFDTKTMQIFWLIGFSGWKAIECYSPHIIWSAKSNQTVTALIKDDANLDDVERAYKERRASAQDLIDAKDPSLIPWPPDIPEPSESRDAFTDPQDKSAFDITCLALAFAFFHEFRHVMLDIDNVRHGDAREEELDCDVWARNFMTAKIADYARDNGHDFNEILRKRSMGFALAALILHEITPSWDHGGNQQYFSVATRLEAILDGTSLPDNDHFWNLAASLLLGIFRQKNIPIGACPMNARELTRYFISHL